MNRAQRRASGGRVGPLPICAPLAHRFQRLDATYRGKVAATRVVCERCSRTFEQVMAESPEDRAAFDAWLQQEPRE